MHREFPRRLYHEVPPWVEDGALFHIRIALERGLKQNLLTHPPLARPILDSATLYQQKERWHITLFLLMPDHLHALLSFPRNESMSGVISDWKRFHARKDQVAWQEGYFDHRLRDDERGEQLSMKIDYIRRNPIAAGFVRRHRSLALDHRAIRVINALGESVPPNLRADIRAMKPIDSHFLIKPEDLDWRPSNMMKIPNTDFLEVRDRTGRYQNRKRDSITEETR